MKHILLQPDFLAWREAARQALHDGYRPEEIDFQDAAAPASLTLALEVDEAATGTAFPKPRTTKGFLELATYASVHRDPSRWNLLYRVLYRLQTEPNLLHIETDPDVLQLMRFSAQVRRDLHKMHAFVRFRKVLRPGELILPGPEARPEVIDEPLVQTDPNEPAPHHLVLATPTPFGVVRTEIEQCSPPDPPIPDADDECEHFIAWYQPDHRILPLAAPFFADRFAIMRWTILTPDESVSWSPVTKKLVFSPGLPRESAPAEDELEDLWRSYYASIFNPARVNPDAMRSEMPVRYWKDLPEVSLLPDLLTKSTSRVASMVTVQKEKPTAQPFLPEDHSIPSLRAALPHCRGCDLYCHAKQAVPGNGNVNSRLMLVGEQPGDQEDTQGLPFVGPAGQVLDRALHEVGIERSGLFLTNAVKHFKFVQRGKLRLHQNPRMSEIMACRPWLLAEIEAVKPSIILCLGASASKSLLGGTFALMRDHGKVIESPLFGRVMATIHPSAVLRARDQKTREELFAFLKEDLATAHGHAKREQG